jgi:hypothetical protein
MFAQGVAYQKYLDTEKNVISYFYCLYLKKFTPSTGIPRAKPAASKKKLRASSSCPPKPLKKKKFQ